MTKQLLKWVVGVLWCLVAVVAMGQTPIPSTAYTRDLLRAANAAAARTALGLVTTNVSITALASETNSGAMDTNQFLKLERDNDKSGIWRHCPLFIDTWYHYGSAWTYSQVSNEIVGVSASGLSKMYDVYYILDDGWQTPTNTGVQFGVTNGILMPYFPKLNITNLCTLAHSNGVGIILYQEPTLITSSGQFYGIATNWEANARAWRDWGIDGLKIDFAASGPDEQVQFNWFHALVNDAKRGFGDKPLAIFTGGWRDKGTLSYSSNLFLGQVTELANCVRLIPDDVGNGIDGTWTNYIGLVFPAYERNKQFNRPGHWLHFDVSQLQIGSQLATNMSLGMVLMNAMMSYPMDVPLTGTPTSDPTRWFYLSNPAIRELHNDALYDPMYLVTSNEFGMTWVKRRYDGSKTVAFLNSQTNVTFTTNIAWEQIGFQSNQLCSVYTIWPSNTFLTNAYGGFGTTVSNMSASGYNIALIPPTNNVANSTMTSLNVMSFFNVDGGSISTVSSYTGDPGLIIFGNTGANNRAEWAIPAELVTTTSLKVVFRFRCVNAGTVPLYFLCGWEQAGVNNFDATTGGQTVSAGTPVNVTNTFTVAANPDSVGLRFGMTSAATNNMVLESIRVLAQ